MTLDATLNPDFSQVEADFAQLEENATFALFYPETRPFFLEGEDYYSSPMQAVFTRTVADPDVGAKFTGRTRNNTIGMFATNDVVTNLLFPGPVRLAYHFARAGERRVRRPLHARLRPSVDDRCARDEP